MRLFAWQPGSGGELSFFVCAETEERARVAVEAEIMRRQSLSFHHADYLNTCSVAGFGTDYYTLTAVEPGVVLMNSNE